jgi:hypothetical protein
VTNVGGKPIISIFNPATSTIWDGTSLTRPNHNADKAPDLEDYNRLATELIALQKSLVTGDDAANIMIGNYLAPGSGTGNVMIGSSHSGDGVNNSVFIGSQGIVAEINDNTVQIKTPTSSLKIDKNVLTLDGGALTATVIVNPNAFDAKTQGDNNLYVVPAGKTFYITGIQAQVESAVAPTGTPTFSLGITAAAYADIVAATTFGADTTGRVKNLTLLDGTSLAISGGTTIKCRVSVAALGTTYTMRIRIIGELR